MGQFLEKPKVEKFFQYNLIDLLTNARIKLFPLFSTSQSLLFFISKKETMILYVASFQLHLPIFIVLHHDNLDKTLTISLTI